MLIFFFFSELAQEQIKTRRRNWKKSNVFGRSNGEKSRPGTVSGHRRVDGTVTCNSLNIESND